MNTIKKIKSATSILIAFAFIMIISSCLKDDEPVILPEHSGDAQLSSINIGEDYSREVYYDLETKDTLGNNFKDWDLAFECGSTGSHVWINGGKASFAAQTNSTNMVTVTDTAQCEWKFDASSWHPDSTAIGNWQSATGNRVYIIDRGYEYSDPDRFWKIIFNEVNSTSYAFSYCRLSDTNVVSKSIFKSSNHSYIFFTFDNNGTTLNLEPEKTKWDILFTRYRYIYYDFIPPLPYYVNGVLLNPYLTMAATDSVTDYNAIDYNFAKLLALSTKRDAIGFDWKYYSFSTTHYNVKPNFIYIIKDQKGYYYKLHFLDFYDAQGHKGVPKFEYQRL
ncbi:MAG: HmuY family protein [Bacteroidia bacterium]